MYEASSAQSHFSYNALSRSRSPSDLSITILHLMDEINIAVLDTLSFSVSEECELYSGIFDHLFLLVCGGCFLNHATRIQIQGHQF